MESIKGRKARTADISSFFSSLLRAVGAGETDKNHLRGMLTASGTHSSSALAVSKGVSLQTQAMLRQTDSKPSLDPVTRVCQKLTIRDTTKQNHRKVSGGRLGSRAWLTLQLSKPFGVSRDKD